MIYIQGLTACNLISFHVRLRVALFLILDIPQMSLFFLTAFFPRCLIFCRWCRNLPFNLKVIHIVTLISTIVDFIYILVLYVILSIPFMLYSPLQMWFSHHTFKFANLLSHHNTKLPVVHAKIAFTVSIPNLSTFL